MRKMESLYPRSELWLEQPTAEQLQIDGYNILMRTLVVYRKS